MAKEVTYGCGCNKEVAYLMPEDVDHMTLQLKEILIDGELVHILSPEERLNEN